MTEQTATDAALAAERAAENSEDVRQNAKLKATEDALAKAQADDAADDAQIALLQAEVDRLKASQPPPAPATKTIMGSSVNGPLGGKTHLDAARVFLPGNCPAKMTDNADFRAAQSLGATHILLSWKDQDLTRVETMLATKPAGIEIDTCYWHEPEDDNLDPAAYRAIWAKQGPLMRKHGCVPTLVLMRFTLNASSGRNWKDYFPAGSVDILGFDSYNLGNKKGVYTPASNQLDPIIAAAASVNLPWAIGETGAPILPGYTAKDRTAWAAQLRAHGEANNGRFMLWWDQAAAGGGFDYRLDAPTATAWLD